METPSMALAKCYACKRVVATESEACSHCGANLRQRGHSSVRALMLLAVACALAFPIVNGM